METVWVLESVYECTREDIYRFLETLRKIVLGPALFNLR